MARQIVGEVITPVISKVIDDKCWLVGLIVELPSGAWEYRELYPEDRCPVAATPDEQAALIPYLRVSGARNYATSSWKGTDAVSTFDG